jgi:signal transduction histidine kinase
MSLRQQQIAVFLGTILLVFSIFAGGVWLITQRLTTEATLQTALLMARQVEIALADSLRERTVVIEPRRSSSSFWDFLGNLLPGKNPAPRVRKPSRRAEVKGLMRQFIDRGDSIEAMWVVNSEGKTLYSSRGGERNIAPVPAALMGKLRHGDTTISSLKQGENFFYDVWVPLQMPPGVRSPGGLRLWINPAHWTELLSAMWRQLVLLFALGGGVALISALLTTALYTRRFRLISETLSRAAAGTYENRPAYASRDEVGKSLDLIDRLVMKQRKTTAVPAPVQRLAVAARALAHEVRTPMNALAIHLELLRNQVKEDGSINGQSQRAIEALDSSIRQVDRLVRDFTDYSAPVTMERKPIDASQVLAASMDAINSPCAAQKIQLIKDLPPAPWPIQGDAARLRQTFDNLLRNAMEAQPNGGRIELVGQKNESQLTLDISDAGPGVPPEQRQELFEFGKTTKVGGSGIGLPLSQLIVESHGGSLTYRNGSGAGGGASFRIVLPMQTG